MDLVQCRIVTDRVEAMAHFYATVIGTTVALNEFYVEVSAGRATVGFSKARYTEDHASRQCGSGPRVVCGESILDFAVSDLDAEYARISALGVDWVLPPTRQPWGARSMIFRDPESHLISVFCRERRDEGRRPVPD